MTILRERPVQTGGLSSSRNGVPGEVPPLENGDRLTRAEFERRYMAMPELKKAELIEGKVYVGSPVRNDYHGGPHLWAGGWLFNYQAATPGVMGSDNSTVRMDRDNVPQPDLCLRIPTEVGGKCPQGEDGYLEGAPELIFEIAASTVSYDLHDKLHVYRRNGVREYVVWRVRDREIDWLQLKEDRYEPQSIGDDGIYRSEVFPGLWLDVKAMIDGNLPGILGTLNRGLETEEHQSFVQALAAVGSPQPETGGSESSSNA